MRASESSSASRASMTHVRATTVEQGWDSPSCAKSSRRTAGLSRSTTHPAPRSPSSSPCTARRLAQEPRRLTQRVSGRIKETSAESPGAGRGGGPQPKRRGHRHPPPHPGCFTAPFRPEHPPTPPPPPPPGFCPRQTRRHAPPFPTRPLEYPVLCGVLLYDAALVAPTTLVALFVTALAAGSCCVFVTVCLARRFGSRACRWRQGRRGEAQRLLTSAGLTFLAINLPVLAVAPHRWWWAISRSSSRCTATSTTSRP